MFTAYIIEDEIRAIELLENYIQRIDYIQLLGTARHSLQAFHYLQEHAVDLIFLDINMPILSGLELYKNLQKPPKVIFTTAYPEYAVEGFNLQAVDYLLKPITFSRFLQACERWRQQQQKISSVDSSIMTGQFADLIYVKSGVIMHKLSWRSILYLAKEDNYVTYRTLDKRILSRQTLSDLERTFPKYICRIHKSYAVSLLKINQLARDTVTIGEVQLPIGRTYREAFLKRIDWLNNTMK